MEKMPYQPEMELEKTMVSSMTATTTAPQVATSEWRSGLPLLAGSNFTLRELRTSDAASLLAMLTTEEVSRFISPPPTTIDGFERFISWTHRERQAGNYVCFAVVPKGMVTAVGIFQVRSIEAGFASAEWGFAMGSPYWGSGIFAEGARLVVDFAFDTVGVGRLEARACIANGRGNGALRKIGAVQEGVLRRSFMRNGQYFDQALWSILADDWRMQRHVQQSTSIH
jgi:RimJ/RimL family protein N-acetyltransferase